MRQNGLGFLVVCASLVWGCLCGAMALWANSSFSTVAVIAIPVITMAYRLPRIWLMPGLGFILAFHLTVTLMKKIGEVGLILPALIFRLAGERFYGHQRDDAFEIANLFTYAFLVGAGWLVVKLRQHYCTTQLTQHVAE